MDLEQLKLILETIQSVGGDTKDVFVWYLVFCYGSEVLVSVLTFVAVVFAIHYVRKIVLSIVSMCSVASEVAAELDYRATGDWFHSDTRAVIALIRGLKEK